MAKSDYGKPAREGCFKVTQDDWDKIFKNKKPQKDLSLSPSCGVPNSIYCSTCGLYGYCYYTK